MGYEGFLQRATARAKRGAVALGPVLDFTNGTPFTAEVLLLSDAAARSQVTLIAKATYAIGRGGRLALAEEQAPVRLFPEPWDDAPGASLRHESDAVPFKPAADVLLLGTVVPRRGRTTEVDVALHVGSLVRRARVFGDRRWEQGRSGLAIGPAEPFERMPLVHERAYGGTAPAPGGGEPVAFAANPVGRGFVPPGAEEDADGALLPNLEDPGALVTTPADRPAPAAFGVVSPGWSPRVEHLGTFDEAWRERRAPHLPLDFDPRFWNVAPPALRLAGGLRAGDHVEVEGVSPDGALRFELPAVALVATVRLAPDEPRTVAMRADTLVVDADRRLVEIVLRASFDAHERLLDLAAVDVSIAAAPGAPEEAHGRR